MKLDVLNVEGEKTGRSVNLPRDIFDIPQNDHVIYLAVKQHNANKRQGNSKAKERNEITGSSRKIKRQKGTGTARAGDIKNPLFRGGGRTFGPQPRDYNLRLNKKVKSLARKSALSTKAREGQILVVEDFTFETPKTSEFQGFLENLEIETSKVLFVTGDYDNTLYLSSRNIPKAKVVEARNINVYDVVLASKLIFSESAIKVISNTFKS
jgi:large subunit ribosomal protein L4